MKKLEKEISETAAKEKTDENKLLVKAIAYEKAGLVSKADKVYASLIQKHNTSINQQLYSLFKIRNNLLAGVSGW